MFSNSGARKSVDSLSPWSPTSQAEFPFHRQGSITSHPRLRRGSTASSIHSVGGQLDTSSGTTRSHSVHESGQNAISTLLQPPIVRTGLLPHTAAPASSAHKPPTARDIPPVTLTSITRVDSSDFKPYLAQVGALYEQLRRMKEGEDDEADQVFRRGSRADEFPAFVDDGHLRPGSRSSNSRRMSTASVSSLSPIERPSLRTGRRTSSAYGRKAAQGPPPLSTIPTVYFDEDFHLENPRTFDVVSEKSEVVRPVPGSAEDKSAANGGATAPRKALATNAILQEKLSWYMDTIEMHLISSISSASTTFFTALGSLRELHSEAADSVSRIKVLRKELEALDREIATTGLDVLQKRRRRENLQQLGDAIKQLKEIIGSVATCESLVDAGELEKALLGIEALENLISGQGTSKTSQNVSATPHLSDLRDAVALNSVNGDISTLRFRIGKAFESRFLEVLLGDLRQHVDTVSSQEVLLRWSSSTMRGRGGHAREASAFPAYLAKTDVLRKELMPILVGLHRSKHIEVAITTYREIILREIRTLVKRPLPTSHDDDNESMMSASTMSAKRLTQQEKSSILARNLRSLDEPDAEALFSKIYISVTETLRRLSTQVKILFDVASSMGDSSTPDAGLRSPPLIKSPPLNSANREIQEDIHIAMDMANLTGQAVDIAQEKIVKVLRVRSEQSTHLPLVWFLRYFTLNLYFANECEAISGRSGTPLKTVVNNHIRDFIKNHGDKEMQKLAQGMESDQWSAKDFGEKESVLLNLVLECSTKDSVSWAEGSIIWTPFSDADQDSTSRPRSESNGTTKEKTRSAMIDSEPFLLPNSAILCLEGMSHFLHLISGIPSMSSDISSSLIAYLHLFNSRCTQLILGAGATRSAGLKNITTRHLVLASQALAFISTLIPHVREFVRRHAGSGPNVSTAGVASLMGEFDKVRRKFQEHQDTIYTKLIEIMTGRASAHVKSMKAVDWDQKSDNVNLYMETLVKETVTLHRVLAKHLPEPTVRVIMSSVFEKDKDFLGRAIEGLEVKSEGGTNRMKSDVDYLVARLGKIDGFGDTGDKLLEIIGTKETQRRAAAASTQLDASTAAQKNSDMDTKDTQTIKDTRSDEGYGSKETAASDDG